MGVSRLTLVAPKQWEYDAAAPPATGKALAVLGNVRVAATLAEALTGCTHAFGATARTGGWRLDAITPKNAAEKATRAISEGGSVALVFGPEDRGLKNAEVDLCTHLVTIPTAPDASSLNLAQAVLVVLYELFTASLAHAYHPNRTPKSGKISRQATIEEQELLFATLRDSLVAIDFLPKDNPEWFMQPLRRFFRRAAPRRHEFDLFMGICRKMRRLRPVKTPRAHKRVAERYESKKRIFPQKIKKVVRSRINAREKARRFLCVKKNQ